MKNPVRSFVVLALICCSCGRSARPLASAPPIENGTVQVPGLMTAGRFAPAVTLKSGNVLVVGGFGSLSGTTLASGEVYHPASRTFTQVANQLPIAARGICLAALNDGTALEAGGEGDNGNPLTQAEIYNPATNAFAPTAGPMNDSRDGCTATTLQDGTVLIAGGYDAAEQTTDTAEIYNPASGAFSYTKGKMINARMFHAAVLLADGKVLLAGGLIDSTQLTSAELYDPASGTFTATAGALNSPRFEAAAVPLADGRALIAGGGNPKGGAYGTAELYDPVTSTFSFAANNMTKGRAALVAVPLPGGNALVGAGVNAFPYPIPKDASFDLFNSSTNTFSPTGSLHIARSFAAAVVLADGSPLVLGGIDDQNANENYEPSGELYNLSTATFTVTGGLNSLRVAYGSAALPDGRVLLAGGANETMALDDAELFDPETLRFTPTANNLDVPRVPCLAVGLKDGTVLIATGSGGTTAEIFDPTKTTFSLTAGSMTAVRFWATGTLLGDGTVLIAGGYASKGSLNTAELYNPTKGTFSATKGTMISPRAYHTATLLANGQVLLAGGTATSDSSGALNSAEIYDPNTKMFIAVPNTMTSPRLLPTANQLGDGRVLIAGGQIANGDTTDTAELFDPKTNIFTATAGVMSNRRGFHSSVSLPDGRVVIAGGIYGGDAAITTSTVDFYNPSTGLFKAGMPMLSPRDYFTATLLQSGGVLIPGGLIEGNGTGVEFSALETAEIYTPGTP